MKNYPNSIKTTLLDMEKSLSRQCPGIKVVLPDNNSAGMILPDEDSAYVHVYLLNVPGDSMLDIEDAAYDIWEAVRPESVSFFLYTPEETAQKYPDYVAKQDKRQSGKILEYLRNAQEWQAESQFIEPQRESWELVYHVQQMIGVTCVGSIRTEPPTEYHTTTPSSVAADTELAKAA